MAAHPRIKETILFLAFVLLFGSGFLDQWATEACRDRSIDCFIGWSSTLSCLILFVMLTALALHQNDPAENIARFWESKVGKHFLITLSILIPGQIAWHMWQLTIARYERGEHDLLMLIYGYIGVVSSLWAILIIIALSCRLIMHRRATPSP